VVADTRPAELATLGRRIAEAQGFNPRDPSVNWEAYGREAEYRIKRRQGVPDPAKFSRIPPAPLASSHRATSSRGGGAAAPPPHRVRIGGLEFSFIEEEPARNRPQRARRKGERTTGRYRSRHAAAIHHHRHGGKR